MQVKNAVVVGCRVFQGQSGRQMARLWLQTSADGSSDPFQVVFFPAPDGTMLAYQDIVSGELRSNLYRGNQGWVLDSRGLEVIPSQLVPLSELVRGQE